MINNYLAFFSIEGMYFLTSDPATELIITFYNIPRTESETKYCPSDNLSSGDRVTLNIIETPQNVNCVIINNGIYFLEKVILYSVTLSPP